MAKIVPVKIMHHKASVPCLVDDADYEYLSQFKWRLNAYGYPIRSIRGQRGKSISMHRDILQAPKGQQVDHRDRNRLNNQRLNLRFCSPSENSRNKKQQSNNTSGFCGVVWDERRNKWYSKIGLHRGSRWLGYFDNKEEAARAYNEAAKELHGEFAILNDV